MGAKRAGIDEQIASTAAEFHTEWPEGLQDVFDVRVGMTPEQVVMMEAEPDGIEYCGTMSLWLYGDHSVMFNRGVVAAIFDRPARGENPGDRFEDAHSAGLAGHPCCRAFMTHMRRVAEG